MSKANHRFRERELTRAIRAAQKAGVHDFTARVTPSGAIEIETRATDPPPPDGGRPNSFDEVLGRG